MKMLLSARQRILEKVPELTDQSILQEMGCFVLLLKGASWHCASAAESQLPSEMFKVWCLERRVHTAKHMQPEQAGNVRCKEPQKVWV